MILFALILVAQILAQPTNNRIVVNGDLGKFTINKHIYGHFSEHLGHCIYEGFWVGENSSIPNTRGIRNDVVAALRALQIPNLRWPGGCFADEYHWMDGIGPRQQRPKMINTHWGGVTEDNSFGTHEFMDLCEQLGCEPYITGNLGSGSVEEMSKWVEYLNSDAVSPMTELRQKNGREKPWQVKYWAVGNENWGCGGNMTPEFYADQYRRYATYCRNYGNHRLFKVACGPAGADYHWTETLMKNIPLWMMNAIALHHYTVLDWNHKGAATHFTEAEYFTTIQRCLVMQELLEKHTTIMDRYDPEKRVALLVDEWGTWWDVEPGTNPGFLYQQNTLRDALVAAISLNIFNTYCERVQMACIAQTVNVLQAMILTQKEKMTVTPTYHVFEMYKVHQDATLLPLDLQGSDYEFEGQKVPAVSASASKDKAGVVHLSLTNVDPKNVQTITCELRGMPASKVTGRILTAPELHVHNTFENPNAIQPTEFKGMTLANQVLTIKLPAKSMVVLSLQ
ncbi:alpha-N-arabinofuranosidase [candidate division KSB1 bacterium]|nr:alpha-N-arabinofuranosidase [candidate division KSB1 bacterium]